MFTLVAATRQPILNGIVSTQVFKTLDEAEKVMHDWAHYGVENQCNEADEIYICDAKKRLVRIWNWGRRCPVAPA